MAEEVEQTGSVDIEVVDEKLSAYVGGLIGAINDTYSYASKSLFYALLPSFYRDYAWRYLRIAAQWMDGYVWSLHSSQSGIISTRIASKLITGLTKQIVGEKLLFKAADKGSDSDDTLKFVGKWSEENNIIKAVYAAIGFALGLGTSEIKINKTIDDTLWWEACRLDSCYYLSSFKNEVEEATFFIRSYTDTRANKGTQQFYLVEHRYYKTSEGKIRKNPDGTFDVIEKKGQKIPYVCYEVHRAVGTIQNNLMPTNIHSDTLNWTEIPKVIRDMIKKDYSAIMIGEEQKLGLPNLGVEPLLNGEIDLSVPTGINFGESMLVGIQDDLLTYEIASSYLIRDMYLGKGTVYVPKSLNVGDLMFTPGNVASGGVLSGLGEDKYETVKGVSPENQQIIVQQFNLRVEEWQKVKENSLKNIAVKWGMSPKILSSFLAQGQAQQTATQIDSEDDMSIAFISHERSYFKNAFNRLLETTLNFYGYAANVDIKFASPSLVNKDRLLDRTIKELENGLIDIDEAIRDLNPDLDEEAIGKKIETAKKVRSEMAMAQFNEMNPDGTFGDNNNYDDLGGANLGGSTNPNPGA